MKRISSFVFIMSVLLLFSCSEKTLSVRMLESEMARNPKATYLDGRQGQLKWNYTTGLELLAFMDVAERYGLEEPYMYAKAWADTMISGGKIATYKKSNYNVDHICPGRIYFRLYEKYGDEGYKAVLDTLYSQLKSHPKTSEGALWHKKIYPHQVWLDGLYMAQPFLAEYAVTFLDGELKYEVLDEIVNDFVVTEKHTYDETTGLYRHAWDESRSMFWCNPQTGQSAHAWGRANGWFALALVDVIAYLPEDYAAKETLAEMYSKLMRAVRKYADAESGMWYQVLDCPGAEGNYLEATCAAMFSASLLKARRLGILDEDLSEYALEVYPKFLKSFVSVDENGLVSLDNCCAVAGLGGKNMRSGDYEYYLSEPIISNDCKGVGPLLWASLEWEALTK